MTLPPQGSPHYELRRRIAGCRERLRRTRTAHRAEESGAQADKTGRRDASADEDEEDGNVPRTPKRGRG